MFLWTFIKCRTFSTHSAWERVSALASKGQSEQNNFQFMYFLDKNTNKFFFYEVKPDVWLETYNIKIVRDRNEDLLVPFTARRERKPSSFLLPWPCSQQLVICGNFSKGQYKLFSDMRAMTPYADVILLYLVRAFKYKSYLLLDCRGLK